MKMKNGIKQMKNIAVALLALGLCANTGCELSNESSTPKPAEPQTYSLNGTKWITPAISEGADPRTFGRAEYLVSVNGRLLLRFEDLARKVSEISLAEGRRVYVDIA